MNSESSGPLRPRLDEVEQVVEQAIDEVCDGPPPQELNTGELIRVEETLAIAAEAAKEAVTLRRKMRAQETDESNAEKPR